MGMLDSYHPRHRNGSAGYNGLGRSDRRLCEAYLNFYDELYMAFNRCLTYSPAVIAGYFAGFSLDTQV
jgi:hypothetical protein